MTLEEYAKIIKDEIDAFVAAYNDGVKATPAVYPTDMEEGDWDQQLVAFLATRSDTDAD